MGDYTINVTAKIDEVNRSKKKTNIIDVINTYEPYSRNIQISNVYAPGWKINNVGKLTMYSFYENDTSTYDAEGYRNMAAHEFGHLLGIGDAYEEHLDGTPKIRLTGEVPVDDLMRGGKAITYNDIEMVFLAALKNQKQEFDSSEAITEGTQ